MFGGLIEKSTLQILISLTRGRVRTNATRCYDPVPHRIKNRRPQVLSGCELTFMAPLSSLRQSRYGRHLRSSESPNKGWGLSGEGDRPLQAIEALKQLLHNPGRPPPTISALREGSRRNERTMTGVVIIGSGPRHAALPARAPRPSSPSVPAPPCGAPRGDPSARGPGRPPR
jgi:hypothetical protein